MALRGLGVGGIGAVILGLIGCCAPVWADGSRYAMTHSRSQFVHWIYLYDADGTRIDPTDPDAPPYSPKRTCGRCHDYDAIAHGYHFNATDKLADAGRRGEPWIWTDNRTGTQIPLSYRGWAGTCDPRDVGVSEWDLLLKFGRHMPGGGPGEFATAEDDAAKDDTAEEGAAEEGAAKDDNGEQKKDEPPGRWHLSGQLEVDCMICHSQSRIYSPEIWWEQISKQNFAWAPTAALALADVEGAVSNLPADFKPAAKNEESPDAESPDAETVAPNRGPTLPHTHYNQVRMNAEKRVFFDVVLKPSNDACYYCHTTRVVGENASPSWTHDEDVHLRAGMSCTDCHRNGIGHHMVRGYEGEEHPTGAEVATLSCRGCHMDQQDGSAQILGGRMGAPKPLHRGLPPLHLERLACTTCHSGPRPGKEALQVQTALAHGLGLPSNDYSSEMQPGIVAPVLLRQGSDKVLYPHRAVWPAFWGSFKSGKITPMNPETVYDLTRRTLRVRRDSFAETLSKVRLTAEDKTEVLGKDRASVAAAELTDDETSKLADLENSKKLEAFRNKLGDALAVLKGKMDVDGAEPVYVAGGRVYRLAKQDTDTAKEDPDAKDKAVNVVETFEHTAAEPYAWKLAHDVRPARWSSGATGCFECHSLGASLFDGNVTAIGPALDPDPPSERMAELAGYDRTQIDAWNLSFQGRTAFKWFGFVSAGVVGLILVSFLFIGLNGVFRLVRRS